MVSKWYEDTYKNGKLKIIVLNQEKKCKKISTLKEPFFLCQNNLRFEFGIDKYPR